MENREMLHSGIKGMKWGIRRFQNKDGSLTPAGRKRYKGADDADGSSTPAKKPTPEHIPKKVRKNMSEDDIKARINRLKLEKELADLEKTVYPQRGKKFVVDVLEKSGKNIAEQITTHMFGSVVNKVCQEVFGQLDDKYKKYEFVNPKKGQKDK